jgi:hypothetical protein
MRRSRRGGRSAIEFASSGEDSFVAVVVTKLTGALLFILLLTMVIMALLPKAVDLESRGERTDPQTTEGPSGLRIATPEQLPDAVAGRPYLLALAATGGRGPLVWSIAGPMPSWLALDQAAGRIGGTPPEETSSPLPLELRVSDGVESVAQLASLLVLPGQVSTSLGSSWKVHLAAVNWRAWLEHGVGFLVLWLIHLLGMNLLANIERSSLERTANEDVADGTQVAVGKRFARYRLIIRLTSLSAMTALAMWLLFAAART